MQVLGVKRVMAVLVGVLGALFAGLGEAKELSPAHYDLSAMPEEADYNFAGQWLVFPSQFLDPTRVYQLSPEQKQSFTKPTESFAQILPASSQPQQGFASYPIFVDNIPNDQSLAFVPPEAFTAYDIYWIPQEGSPLLLFRAGRIGTSPQESYPGSPSTRPVAFPEGQKAGAILIHLSNFHHSWGGMWLAPSLGSASRVMARTESIRNGNYLMIGVLLFISFSNLSLFFRRREDRGSLWLALLSFGFAVRVFAYIGGFDSLVPKAYAFSVHKKIIYASMLGLAALGFLFFQTYFPRQFPRWLTRFSLWLSIPIACFIFVTPPTVFGFLGTHLTNIGAVFVLVQMILVTRVFLAKESGGTVCFLGTLGVLVGSLMEVGTVFGWFQGILNSMAYGLVIFMAFQSQIVAVRFVEAFRRSEHLSRELQKEVERQTRDIRSILDAIQQGIFTLVAPNLLVGEQFSPHSRQMFETEQLQGQSLHDLLLSKSDLSSDQKDQVDAALGASMGEDSLNFDINADCFPQEIRFQAGEKRPTKILELDWSPICDAEGRVDKILVCSRDVTEIRALRTAAEQREKEFSILQELIQIPEDRFARFLLQARTYLTENSDFLIAASEGGSPQIAKRMFVNLHTLKGTARTYQFKQLAARVHDAEHFLSQYIKELVSWSSATVGQDLEEIKACLVSYEHIARSKLRWTLNNSVVKVSKEDLLQLLPHLKGLEEEGLTAVGKAHLATLGNTLIANCYTKLNELVKEVARSLDSIARDLGKLPPELTLSPNHFLIDDKWTDRLQGTLTHLLRNAMDHGLEKPDERFRAGKSEKGRIFLRTSCEMSFLRLEIQDDGRGLNLPKITEIAMEKGLISGPLASEQETAELIFHSGFSTKSQVSDISGRGVGMDAVRALVSEGGGQVFLELDPNSPDKSHYGFAVVLLLPAEAWTVLTEEPAA